MNSINWARIVAQVVYYFKAYFAVTRRNGEPVSFSVPSGNFGNIFAGHVAQPHGAADQAPHRRHQRERRARRILPHRALPRRARRRTSHATSSPSMDISKSSNFERFIWDVGRQGRRQGRRGCGTRWKRRAASTSRPTRAWERIEEDSGFGSGRSTHEDRIADDPAW